MGVRLLLDGAPEAGGGAPAAAGEILPCRAAVWAQAPVLPTGPSPKVSWGYGWGPGPAAIPWRHWQLRERQVWGAIQSVWLWWCPAPRGAVLQMDMTSHSLYRDTIFACMMTFKNFLNKLTGWLVYVRV